MKAAGVVRRFDNLGRIVIPKEIRRSFKIRERDPLEIFVDFNGEVILKKYSPIKELGNLTQTYADSLFEAMGHVICITDRDTIVAVGGAKKKALLNCTIDAVVEEVIRTRKSILISDTSQHEYYRDADKETVISFYAIIIFPIISEGEPVGAVIIGSMSKDSELGESELKHAEIAAGFLAKLIDF